MRVFEAAGTKPSKSKRMVIYGDLQDFAWYKFAACLKGHIAAVRSNVIRDRDIAEPILSCVCAALNLDHAYCRVGQWRVTSWDIEMRPCNLECV